MADLAQQFIDRPTLTIIIVVEAAVIVYLFRLLQALWKEKNDLQEKRLEGTRETIEKYGQVVGDFSQTAKLLLAKLDGKEK